MVLSRYRWLPDIRISDSGDALHYARLGPDGWQRTTSTGLGATTPFSTVALLIPNARCSFRRREFPVDMVAAADLDEAIALDIAQWNSFDSKVSCLSFFERVGESWQVAVWLWPQDEELLLLGKLPDGLRCTHIMPEMAWFASRVQGDHPQLLVHAAGADDSVDSTYALVSSSGVPLAVSQVQSESEGVRFWRALGSQTEAVERALLCNEDNSDEQPATWLPDGLESKSEDWRSVRYGLLARARLKGVKDWSDPLSWKKQLLALLFLLVIWMAADALVLVERMDRVNQQLNSVEQGAHEVLDYREQVMKNQRYLQHYTDLKSLQYQHEWLLAGLSTQIPQDIWLNVMQSGDGWVDIRGQGKDVIRLVVLLEKIKGVKQALLLNDIRPDARSGLESFQLRLVLGQ